MASFSGRPSPEDGAPGYDKITIEVGDARLVWPREALEDGARMIGLSEGPYMEAEHFALSVQAVLASLKRHGVETISL
jgi:hypothetical protein